MSERSIPDCPIFINKSCGKIKGILSTCKSRPHAFLPFHAISVVNKQQSFEFYLDTIKRHHDPDVDILNKIIFTEEATNTTNGVIYLKNKHCWSRVDFHKKQEIKDQSRKRIFGAIEEV